MNDLLFLMVFGLVAVIIIIISFINPSKKEEEKDPPRSALLVVDIAWDATGKADVDLWGQAPDGKGGSAIPVGYSRLTGPILSLFRDDQGKMGEHDKQNVESMMALDLIDGEYIFNVHLYNQHGDPEANIAVTVRIRDNVNHPFSLVYTGYITLKYWGEEKTIVRFEVKDGAFVPESVHYTFRPIAFKDDAE